MDGEVSGVVYDFGTPIVGNKFAFGTGNPNLTLTSLTAVNDGNWHHVAATRNSGTGLMKIYVDGIEEATGTGSTGARTHPPFLRLGSLQTGVGGGLPGRHAR